MNFTIYEEKKFDFIHLVIFLDNVNNVYLCLNLNVKNYTELVIGIEQGHGKMGGGRRDRGPSFSVPQFFSRAQAPPLSLFPVQISIGSEAMAPQPHPSACPWCSVLVLFFVFGISSNCNVQFLLMDCTVKECENVYRIICTVMTETS